MTVCQITRIWLCAQEKEAIDTQLEQTVASLFYVQSRDMTIYMEHCNSNVFNLPDYNRLVLFAHFTSNIPSGLGPCAQAASIIMYSVRTI